MMNINTRVESSNTAIITIFKLARVIYICTYVIDILVSGYNAAIYVCKDAKFTYILVHL